MFHTLLADDSALFRRVVRSVLVRHFPFMVVSEAGDGEKALALGNECPPQLVFIDIKLPDGNGLDIVRHFKSELPGATVCMVAHYDIPEYRIAARECGADHFIVKDESSESAIVALVEEMISNRFRVYLADHSDSLRHRVVDILLRHWPTMVIVDPLSKESSMTGEGNLEPDAVIVSLTMVGQHSSRSLQSIRDSLPGAELILISAPHLDALGLPSSIDGTISIVRQNEQFAAKLVAAMERIVAIRHLRS